MIDKYTLKDRPRPDWLPDWTDPAAYPDHGENAAAWAWEFLRRNPEYQADFAHYWSVPWCYPEGGKTPKLAGRTYNDEAEMIYFYADPPAASPFETVGEYRQRTGVEPSQLETALLHRWGLVTLDDPARNDPVFFCADEPMPPYRDGDPSPEGDGDYIVGLAFDIRLPLDGQLAAAKQILEEERLRGDPNDPHLTIFGEGDPNPIKQIRPPSPRFGNMREYLRTFDAVWTTGWDRQKIATRIFGDRTSKEGAQTGSALKRVDRAIEQALEYVNGDYLDLLWWAGFPKQLNKTAKE